MSKEVLYLVDGTSLCYRSFFAVKFLNQEGFSTGAVYGFYRTLDKIMSKYSPTYMAICFDVSRKTFRNEKFEKYKANRPPMPEGLKSQFPIIKELISSLGIKIVEKKGFEADDVIASLCDKALKNGLRVVVVSSDKDLCQLMSSDKVSMYNYNKDRLIVKDDFFKEYGFYPKQIVDYLALAGDSTDNIPGAKGIGKVGATKLIKEYSNIDNIFKNIEELPEKIKKILLDSKDMVFLSKELATLSLCETDLECSDLKIKEPNNAEIYSMFNNLGFKSLLKKVVAPNSLDLKVKDGLPRKGIGSLGKEGLSIFLNEDNAFIFDSGSSLVYKTKIDEARDLIEDDEIKKISHGFKNQILKLKNIVLRGVWFDVKIAAYLIDSSLAGYDLINLVSHFLEEHVSSISPHEVPYFSYKLYKVLIDKIKEQKLDELFFEVEMPLVVVLSKMQMDGVRLDAGVLDSLLKKVEKESLKTSKEIFKIARKEFNLNSPKQLSVILFDDLKIKPIKKIKTGFSTNEEVLDKLSLRYPIAKYILEYRHLNKLKSTYVIPLIEDVAKTNGLLHTQFNQTVAQTGRLSSSSPNLQSIPVKGKFSSWLREAFISSFDGGYILSGDYSQIELRILAHLTKDENLMEAFSNDFDIHTFTATLLFGIDKDEVNNSQRDIAKRVNFGIIYGMGPYGLAKELKINSFEAQNFIDDYFKRYAGVKNYINKIYKQVEEKGFVETILGRRRILNDINSSNNQLREFSRRQAVNAPIQGSCADLIKIAMVNIFRELNKRSLKTKLIIQIHDELVFDVPKDELDQVRALVKKYMEEAMDLTVPVKVKLKYGKNWAEVGLS